MSTPGERTVKMKHLTSLGLAGIVLLSASASATAQSSNGVVTLVQEQMTSAGGQVGVGNPMRVWTALGDPMGGASTGSHCRVLGGYYPDSTQLPPGHPPAMPTVQPTPPVDPGPTYTLTGTKTPGTSVWVNGVEVVLLNEKTTWSAMLHLTEGDNVLVIVTKDAAGHVSASVTKTIVVDNLPPVISDVVVRDPEAAALRQDPRLRPPMLKTNFTQVTVSGQVDDHLVTVQINGAGTLHEGRRFSVTLPLQMGQNVLTIVATSRNQYVSQQPVEVAKGTIPAIQSLQPANRGKLYVGTTPTIAVAATDLEQDSLTYQLFIDGQVVRDWVPEPSQPWVLTESAAGPHTIEARVRDAFGGDASRQSRVYVVRKPVPSPGGER